MCTDLKEQFKNELIKMEAGFNEHVWEKDILKRFLLYKTYANELKIDCDVSEKAMESYKKYPYIEKVNPKVKPQTQKGNCKKYEILVDKHVFRGDTMTSGWWFTQQILAFYTNKHYPGVKVRTEHLKSLLKRVDMLTLKENLSEDISRDKDKADMLIKCFTCFLDRIHSVGNMILVPSYFNQERSGCFGRWDCWDITLHAICSWYKDNPNSEDININIVDYNRDLWLIKLFSKGDNAAKVCSVIECKYWLKECFTGVEDFICNNYLQDYFDFDRKCVKSLIDGKLIIDEDANTFFKKCSEKYKPKETSQMIEYFRNFVERTDLREKRLNGEGK